MSHKPHKKKEWSLDWTDKWRNPKKIDLPNLNRNNPKVKEKAQGIANELRRKQFLNFFQEFFDKFEEKTANKNTYGFTFNDEEK